MRLAIPVSYVAGGVLVVGLELVAMARWQGWYPDAMERRVRQQSIQPAAGAAWTPAHRAGIAEPPAAEARPEDRYYAQLRKKLRWVNTRIEGGDMLTPDLRSRMLLAKSAAERAGLQDVGLGFEDVYGIINAETSWVPRTGASKDGTPNLGVAQFEPATAQALGVRDPHDVVEAVHAAALHMKEAAQWSAGRITGLKLSRQERAARLREGVSIYYNLSSKGRAAWNGRNTHKLPLATSHHIRNARLGAQEALFLETQLQAMDLPSDEPASVLTVAAQGKPAYAQ